MTRWSTVIPAASASELLGLKEQVCRAATVALANVLPSDLTVQALGLEASLETAEGRYALCIALAAAGVCTASLLLMSKRAKAPLPNVRDILASDPDLFAFSSFYDRLSPSGPFDKPDLATTQHLVVLAPTNAAFTRDQVRLFALAESEWRFLLLSHVLSTHATQQELTTLNSLPSVTRAVAPLNCLVGTYSDGSRRMKVPQLASNGLVYSIDALVEPGQQCLDE
mmetsp:Transcript_17470/g.44147  ORF Transcript_17470/g.44147 Transcript_17470/m.44147 type:complete len:225 (-) Transcript_17470:33-707(-)|eukprot:CAMPEP_0173422846 /NCGR_PEP_ID=MMETSP1357-20121228/3389_1 /TAXON_ID=77926 /ORGANISM="Hemiselmis rufescens, Strain PCC563" /LENGTH=224 /DNA_ID=CAMNT_0014385901 /DNA_START=228 /DNA_END=902 /DNA_ORIENTATION=+